MKLSTVCRLGAAAAATLLAVPASADAPLRWHLALGGAHAITTPQSTEYGFGADGRAAVELGLTPISGVQLEIGQVWLGHASRPADPSFADHGDGTATSAMIGLRLRPFTPVAGPWIDVNLGYVRTGDRDRPGFDAHLGYDWRVSEGRWDVGPYVGYFEIIQPPDSLRPDDARILSVGVHVALGVERPPPPAPPPPPPPLLPEKPFLPPPPAPPPPSDRDHDGIIDSEDACPDVPGLQTADPKTNGCPAAGDQVHVVKDTIEYDDVIHFDTDQAHIHRASWPILKKLANFIVATAEIQEVDVTGHTDERGTNEHNMKLSQDRADAVRERLIQFGVQPERITTIGFGKTRPRASGHSETEWRQNRRVEFIITKVRNAQGGSTSLTPSSQGVTQ